MSDIPVAFDYWADRLIGGETAVQPSRGLAGMVGPVRILS